MDLLVKDDFLRGSAVDLLKIVIGNWPTMVFTTILHHPVLIQI